MLPNTHCLLGGFLGFRRESLAWFLVPNTVSWMLSAFIYLHSHFRRVSSSDIFWGSLHNGYICQDLVHAWTRFSQCSCGLLQPTSHIWPMGYFSFILWNKRVFMFSFYLIFFAKERVSRNIVHSLKPKRPKRCHLFLVENVCLSPF